MKKVTLLAAAVASVIVSSAAVAGDNSMYGEVRLRAVSQDTLSMSSGKLVIGWKGEEDLGNGMTGFYKLELEHDNAQEEQTGFHNDHSFIGLKGDFGTALIGNFSDFAGWACGATDIFQNHSGEACGVGATNSRLGNSIAYVGGTGAFSIGLGARLNKASGAVLPTTTIDTNGDTVTLDPGSAAVEDSMDTVIAAKFSADAFSVGVQITDADADADPMTVIGGSYKLGDMTLGFTLGDNGTDTGTAIALAMPMAAGTLKVGMDQGDAIADDATKIQYQQSMGKTMYVGVEATAFEFADTYLAGYIGMKF